MTEVQKTAREVAQAAVDEIWGSQWMDHEYLSNEAKEFARGVIERALEGFRVEHHPPEKAGPRRPAKKRGRGRAKPRRRPA